QVGFVDQGGGVEGLPGLLLRHLLGSEPAQFVVDQRQELLGGVRIALFDGGQDTCDLAHEEQHNRPRGDLPASRPPNPLFNAALGGTPQGQRQSSSTRASSPSAPYP